MIVLDASCCAAWILPDEQSGPAERAARVYADEGATVPFLWQLEIRNVLLVAHRRGRLDSVLLEQAFAKVEALGIVVDNDVVLRHVTNLAVKHGLSVYDASYLELAVRRDCPLATLDRRLLAAAVAEGVATT